ncbi:MAG: hypothetical protein ABSB15_16610 [Bryobacteraceae bacterium]
MPKNWQWQWIPAAAAVACVVYLSLEVATHDQLVSPVPGPPKPFVPPPAQRYVAPVPAEIPAPPILPPAPLVTPVTP